jgi:hypothetical protein
MDTNQKQHLLNPALVRVLLILAALMAFILAAGAPACVGCV